METEFPKPELGGLSKSRREIFVLAPLESAPASLNSLYRVALDTAPESARLPELPPASGESPRGAVAF